MTGTDEADALKRGHRTTIHTFLLIGILWGSWGPIAIGATADVAGLHAARGVIAVGVLALALAAPRFLTSTAGAQQ